MLERTIGRIRHGRLVVRRIRIGHKTSADGTHVDVRVRGSVEERWDG